MYDMNLINRRPKDRPWYQHKNTIRYDKGRKQGNLNDIEQSQGYTTAEYDGEALCINLFISMEKYRLCLYWIIYLTQTHFTAFNDPWIYMGLYYKWEHFNS